METNIEETIEEKLKRLEFLTEQKKCLQKICYSFVNRKEIEEGLERVNNAIYKLWTSHNEPKEKKE